ncbi:hypothetical protein [Alkalihalophilus marmarensis]|uniref:hypothetical protein n=1 Tax=Alkalihalophilus marmarensis TaxID=521377 RepID=UPI002DB6E020|nr:hypothetical protein [Alkalihalophilus marmarensis]MEC2070549.1 hypothetical protein [Alkalihalophilus marmarensis]
MFNGNKLVLILPAILMAIMFWGGYHFLGENETLTHEQLKEETGLVAEADDTGDGWLVNISWEWASMPDGGLYGEDYVSAAVLDEDGHAREDITFTDMKLELVYGDEVIYETEGEAVSNGVIFAYPNEIQEHQSLGNNGQAVVRLNGDEINKEDISIRMLHTWVNHSPLTKEDALFSNPDFSGAANVPYWVKEETPAQQQSSQ